MRILIQGAIAGFGFTTCLVCLATIPRTETQIGKAAEFLQIPGLLVGFALGSGRVHDLSFWVLTAVLNAVFYSLLVCGVLWVRRSLRARASAKRTARTLGEQPAGSQAKEKGH
jgi:hypothetical protein